MEPHQDGMQSHNSGGPRPGGGLPQMGPAAHSSLPGASVQPSAAPAPLGIEPVPPATTSVFGERPAEITTPGAAGPAFAGPRSFGPQASPPGPSPAFGQPAQPSPPHGPSPAFGQPPQPHGMAGPGVPPSGLGGLPPQGPSAPGQFGNPSFGPSFGGPAPGQPMAGYGQGPAPMPGMMQPSRPKRKKPLVTVIVLATLLVLGGGSAAVFGLYLPNTPANVWNTGLERSGESIEKMTLEATTKEKLAAFEQSELTGSVDITADGESFSGTIAAKYDKDSADSTMTVSFDGESGAKQNLGVHVMAEMAKGKELPDMYLKLSGIKALGLDAMAPGVGTYDGKWIGISAAYLEQYLDDADKDAMTAEEFTHEDATALAKIVLADSRKYLFSADPQTAVLVQKSFVGTETLDGGMTANHYTVGINKANAKAYCEALITNLSASPSFKKLPGVDASTIETDKKSSIDDCKKSIDADIKDTDTFDMWIDKQYKLIHKARFTDDKERGDYIEVGQSYKGGDTLPMFVAMHSDKDKFDGRMTLDVDVARSVTNGTFTFKQTGESKLDVNAKFGFKPHQGTVTVQKPAGAIPIQEVFKQLGFDPEALAETELQDTELQDSELR